MEIFPENIEDEIFKISERALRQYENRIFQDNNRQLTEKEKFDYRMGVIHGIRIILTIILEKIFVEAENKKKENKKTNKSQ